MARPGRPVWHAAAMHACPHGTHARETHIHTPVALPSLHISSSSRRDEERRRVREYVQRRRRLARCCVHLTVRTSYHTQHRENFSTPPALSLSIYVREREKCWRPSSLLLGVLLSALTNAACMRARESKHYTTTMFRQYVRMYTNFPFSRGKRVR